MTALPIAVVLGLAGACQSAVDPGTIAKIAQHESGREPYAIHDNTTRRSYFPETKPDAHRLAEELLAAGHSVDVGLSQINAANFSWLGLSLATALDPCTNIHASAAVLVGYSRYNTGSPTRGIANGYATAIQAVRIADITPAPANAVATEIPGVPRAECAAPAWDTWGQAECRDREAAATLPPYHPETKPGVQTK
jgi:type IV secretion system protein VirB1